LSARGDKGQFVEIPAGMPNDNVSLTRYTLKLSPDWDLEGDVQADLKGTGAISMRTDLVGETPERLQTNVSRYFGFGSADDTVSKITHPDFQDSSKPFVIQAHVERPSSGPATSEMILNPWMADPGRTPAFKSSQRQSFLMFESPRTDTTISVWNLPTGVRVEKLPAEVNLRSDMADYSHSCAQSAGAVTCTRTFTLKKTLDMDPKRFSDERKFFDEVAQDDEQLLLLRKN
jgi:hypothetical protein